ncbi:MAG: hypothetical protein N3A01_01980 [Bacteroidales bacterium]|nr:hypothetical protein [Bacteroidales bacterium]
MIVRQTTGRAINFNNFKNKGPHHSTTYLCISLRDKLVTIKPHIIAATKDINNTTIFNFFRFIYLVYFFIGLRIELFSC